MLLETSAWTSHVLLFHSPMSVHTVAEPAFHAVISHSPSKIGFHRPQGTLSGAEYPPPINASHQGILGNPPIKIPAPAETVHLSERYPPYPALSSKIGIHANGISAPVIVITIYAAPGTLAGEIPQPHSPIHCVHTADTTAPGLTAPTQYSQEKPRLKRNSKGN